jgi:hypothetical protein
MIEGDKGRAIVGIPAMIDAIENSIKKISIVLEKINYFKHSQAIDIEKSQKKPAG